MLTENRHYTTQNIYLHCELLELYRLTSTTHRYACAKTQRWIMLSRNASSVCGCASGAARGGGGSFPLWVDVQKLCNMCVLSLSWNFFISHDEYIARPSSKEPRWYTDNTTGTGGLRTLDPYRSIPHFPPVTKSWRHHWAVPWCWFLCLSKRSTG